MTRRLLASNLRRVLNPATTPSPKPFSSPTAQQNPLSHSQSHHFSWQLKPHKSLFFSTYNKLSRGQFIAQSRNAAPMGRLLTRGAHWLSFSLRQLGGPGQVRSSMRRSWSAQILTPKRVVLFLIGANVAVFVLWKIADPSFMRKHFMVSLDNFKNGRLHTLITSAFSHSSLDHIGVNMFCLYYLGGIIGTTFGPKFLLKLYLGGALGGSIFSLIYLSRKSPEVSALGACASLDAISAIWILSLTNESILLSPIRTAIMGVILMTTDVWRIHNRIYKEGDNKSSAAHKLGGAFVAALVWSRIRKLT
ncbi:hypothetical protein LUZ62_074073 [Rhynchospora pubera]|uniref:Peptidase S54 rhomboid domain-containing protein n=1 Tax=Rhynchospora pubera TaxID=906938 RepID=A0AAV8DAB9_9POAL|nr:hypothetical protein LUZ62_074073 [Rhynchospora pubera]